MTICIPKKPFSIIGNLSIHGFRWSWIPILGYLLYYSNKTAQPNVMLLVLPFCFFQMFFTIIWLHDTNEEKHWIQWCKPKEAS